MGLANCANAFLASQMLVAISKSREWDELKIITKMFIVRNKMDESVSSPPNEVDTFLVGCRMSAATAL